MVPNPPLDTPLDEAGVLAVPFARPIIADDGDGAVAWLTARPALGDLPAWRALLETLAVLGVAILGDVLALPLLLFWRPADPRWFVPAAVVIKGLAGIALCAILLRIERRRLSSIGLTARGLPLNLAIGTGAWICTYAGLFVLTLFLYPFLPQLREHENDAAQAIREYFPPMRVGTVIALACFVAVWEEIAFRGFMLARLQAVLKRWWLTVPIGAVLFAVGHAYEGPLAVVITLLLGIVLGFLLWWRKSLMPCVVFHALHNTIMFLMMNSGANAYHSA